jgi:hypothetical protein
MRGKSCKERIGGKDERKGWEERVRGKGCKERIGGKNERTG